jgi:hypothetical protein
VRSLGKAHEERGRTFAGGDGARGGVRWRTYTRTGTRIYLQEYPHRRPQARMRVHMHVRWPSRTSMDRRATQSESVIDIECPTAILVIADACPAISSSVAYSPSSTPLTSIEGPIEATNTAPPPACAVPLLIRSLPRFRLRILAVHLLQVRDASTSDCS